MAEQHHHSSSLSETDSAHTSKVGEVYRVTDNAPNDEISLKELVLKIREWVAYLWTKKWIIIIAGIIGGALGLAYSLVKKPIYTATTTFVLEESENTGGLGQYAGLASMMGVDLGSAGGDIFKGDNIIQLYKSRKMIQKALLSSDTFNGRRQLLIDRYIEFNKMREGWVKQPALANLKFDAKETGSDRLRDSVMGKVIESINKEVLSVAKPDKKLSIIQVDVKSPDEQFSKSFADNIVATVNNFYVITKTKKSSENIEILQHQADSVRQMLNANIGGVAAAIDAVPNINPAMQRLRTSSQKKQVDVQANSGIYQEIVKNLELSKIALRKERPLIQVIDEPVFPLSEEKITKVKAFVFGTAIMTILIVVFLIVKRMYRNLIG